MLDAKPKEISEIQRLNYEQVIDTIFVILKCVIFNLWMYSLFCQWLCRHIRFLILQPSKNVKTILSFSQF